MVTELLLSNIQEAAQKEMGLYGAPSQVHFDLALREGSRLAKTLHANEELIRLGIMLMDIKLGEAFKLGKLGEHIQMSLGFAHRLLDDNTELTEQELSVIFNSIEAHHGNIPHNSLESEIVTNADCYRFIHPIGVTWWNAALGKRYNDLPTIVEQLSFKLEEKWKLVTLPIVKQELQPYYDQYHQLFSIAQNQL